MTELPESLPITPSPRILQMLGHVNFDGWQCVAELVDNSIDAFLRDAETDGSQARRQVKVELPGYLELNNGTASVTVADNAGGMSLGDMQDAVRAGYSGNDPVGRLGLFGMGFNVATARLGRVAEILSHRPGDSEWIGLRIDVDEMVRNRTWNAPVIREPLSESDEPSGTVVRVSRVPRSSVVRGMVWGAGKPALIRRLSRLYHVAMQRHNVHVAVNGEELYPWNLCLWGAERSVPSQVWGRVPAQFPVDIALPTLPYCLNCWEWGTEDQANCYLCGSEMVRRERRIRGILGIQRCFSIAWGEGELSHYGIDLIRNGRVIEQFDKDLFFWSDPNDPGHQELDYPVDGVYLGGRIIGELEVDFVPLRTYHKDGFEKSDSSWSEVRRALRGDAPLRPDIARGYGYERPDTILNRLFDAYRKTSPGGERFLITAHPPGRKRNPRDPMHTSSELSRWIAGFEAGDDAYLTDAKWWEAVQWAEIADAAGTDEAGAEPVTTSIFDSTADAASPPAPPQPSDGPDEEAPFDCVPDDRLTMTVATDGIVANAPSTLRVQAFKVTRGTLPHAYSVTVDPRGSEIGFTWNPRHPDFSQGLMNPVDALIWELAVQLLYRAQVTQRDYPVSYVARQIVQRAFPERDLTVDAAAQRAADLLKGLRAYLEESLPREAPVTLELQPVEVAALERAMAVQGIAMAERDDSVRTGRFVALMPLRFMARCALLFPDLLMKEDGFFALDYASYDTEELRVELREGLYSNLLDLVWLVEERTNLGGQMTEFGRLQMQKSLAALELLELRRIE